ncbi:hypothetical protein [Roseicyclus marinus]|uniref:hypothetical protein n=1 Tax=Roseicyclus marinus TaxID=2161673 RepID=UPI00240FC478|nr:hypothetical protein [Roseicyclus marinus]MDG3043090.1 hypothetical protein [Roseicyclus marinus]
MVARLLAPVCLFGLAGLVAACGPTARERANLISPAAQAGEYPEIQEVAPLLASTDDLLPQQAAERGQNLQARAADLRRRAAMLRQMDL